MFICLDGLCPVHDEPRCCHHCSEQNSCAESCKLKPDDCGAMEEREADITTFNTQYLGVFRTIAEVINEKKALEAQEKTLKDQLREAMEAHGIKTIDNQFLKVTYVAPTVAVSIDSTKLKKKYPAIADECSKSSPKSGYIKVELKE